MSDNGDGSETMEWQAQQIAINATKYNGSAPCPTCGVIISPVEFMQGRGHCQSCLTARRIQRVKGKMV